MKWKQVEGRWNISKTLSAKRRACSLSFIWRVLSIKILSYWGSFDYVSKNIFKKYCYLQYPHCNQVNSWWKFPDMDSKCKGHMVAPNYLGIYVKHADMHHVRWHYFRSTWVVPLISPLFLVPRTSRTKGRLEVKDKLWVAGRSHRHQ